jgi:hypothetical protein
LQPRGFTNKQLRPLLAQLLGISEDDLTPGRMSYDLRRLRLHGLIERTKGTQRYQITDLGLSTSLFNSRLYHRVIRPGISILGEPKKSNSKLARAFDQFQTELDGYFAEQRVA